jgi:glutamyl-tRNA reductase
LTARSLLARGVHSLFVSNRSYDRAAALAEELSGRAVHFDAWEAEMHDVDILISSTAAPHHIVTSERLKPVLATRTDRPLFIIDIAVPRDVYPEVNDLEGVYLYDIDSLQRIAEQALARRQGEMRVCEEMIREHVDEFRAWLAREEPRLGWQRFLEQHRERQLTKLGGRPESGLST